MDVPVVVSPFEPVFGTQRAGASRPYEIDVSSLAVSAWQANVSMPANALVRPTTPNQNGFVYQSTAAGQTGNVEPAWATAGTVKDGSLVWTPLTPPASGEDSIASVAWSQQNPPDATLTISSQSNTGLTATAFIGGGTSGSTYTVVATVTMVSGAIWPVLLYVTIL